MDAFRLAEIVGTADVGAMLNSISPAQFRKWQAWFRVRREEDWLMACTVAAAAWNAAMISKGAGRDALVNEDFFMPAAYKFTSAKAVSEVPPGEAIQSTLAAKFGPRY